MALHAIDDVGDALDATRAFLFPFDRTKWLKLALVVFFVGTSPVIHDFWNLVGKERHNNKINFLKNCALLGCSILLLEAAAEDGTYAETWSLPSGAIRTPMGKDPFLPAGMPATA